MQSGQTPRITSPHPERILHGLHSLPLLGTEHSIEEDPHLLAQVARCFKCKSPALSLKCIGSKKKFLVDLGPTAPVCDLVLDTMGDRVPCPEGMLSVPQYPHESV